MTWPRRGTSRGQRLLWSMTRRAARPTAAPLVATRAEVIHLGLLRLLDDLVAAALLEVSVTLGRAAWRAAWPARQRLAIARLLRDAVRDDFLNDSNERTAYLWRLLNPEERPS